jgi:hypothetical protein
MTSAEPSALWFQTSRDSRGRWQLARVRAVRVLDVLTLGAAGRFALVDTVEADRGARVEPRVVPVGELLDLETLSRPPAEKSASLEKAGAGAR